MVFDNKVLFVYIAAASMLKILQWLTWKVSKVCLRKQINFFEEAQFLLNLLEKLLKFRDVI